MMPVPPSRDTLAVRSCLVLGGARSGKSRYAQELAERSGRTPLYIATATIWDDEMRERVDRHRQERDGGWRTVEEPLELVEALVRHAAPDTVILVDCLTLWLTNVTFAERDVAAETRRLAEALPGLAGPVVLVSNEVGSGIVPDNALARRFRDDQGRLNQAVAQACEAAVLVVAGLPVFLKPNFAPTLQIAV